jgi:hypothetical protein
MPAKQATDFRKKEEKDLLLLCDGQARHRASFLTTSLPL